MKSDRIKIVLLALLMLISGIPVARADDPSNRNRFSGATARLVLKNQTIEQVLPLLCELTGKVVLPQSDILSRRLTVVSEREMSREETADTLVRALEGQGITVVQTRDTLILRTMPVIASPALTANTPALSQHGKGFRWLTTLVMAITMLAMLICFRVLVRVASSPSTSPTDLSPPAPSRSDNSA